MVLLVLKERTPTAIPAAAAAFVGETGDTLQASVLGSSSRSKQQQQQQQQGVRVIRRLGAPNSASRSPPCSVGGNARTPLVSSPPQSFIISDTRPSV